MRSLALSGLFIRSLTLLGIYGFKQIKFMISIKLYASSGVLQAVATG
jgi:hypothetical protein